ncbi:adenylate/guanylate cyclase domain-containing protein [Oscillatoria amoena NRMC-F 0135]|nr:adenylate/guanylate cyclase domain-containing protein [Oscillatoria amoena NRMC-F 0135]
MIRLKPHQKYQLIAFPLLFALACIALWNGLFSSLEFKLFDLKARLIYAVKKNLLPQGDFPAVPATFVAIDQYSVDPALNPDTDRWNAGGWLTRGHYADALRQFASAWQPKALAYDIIFQNYRQQDESKLLGDYFRKIYGGAKSGDENFNQLLASPDFPLDPMIRAVEIEGQNAFANLLWDVHDAAPEMAILWAFNFDYQRLTGGRSLDFTPSSAVNAAELESPWAMLESHGIEFPTTPEQIDPAAFPDGVNLPPSAIANAPLHLAPINVFPDADGVIRRAPLLIPFGHAGEIRAMPSFSLRLFLSYLGGAEQIASLNVQWGRHIRVVTKDGRRFRIPMDRQGQLLLNPTRKLRDFDMVSYWDVIRYGPVQRAAAKPEGLSESDWATRRQIASDIQRKLRGKAVVVGASFTGAGDIVPVSLGASTPGAYVHLLAFANMLEDNCLPPFPGRGAQILILAVITAFFCLGALLLGQSAWLIAAGTLMLAYALLSVTAQFASWTALPFFSPLLMGGLQITSAAAIGYFTESRERRKVRSLFSTMVSPSLLEYLEENHDEALSGKQCEVTVMFSDVAGFTTISESLPVEKLRGLFLDYLSPMTDIILASGGMVDKYIGDAIMGVWGAPLPMESHAQRACQAALEQQRRIMGLRAQLARDYGVDITVRMGLNSGMVSAGNMGSHQRQQYTVMGDCVNQAARLEPINKDYGTVITIGQSTHALLEGRFITRCLDKIVVKGKTSAVSIYELVDFADSGPIPEWITAYESGLKAFWQRRWDEAIGLWTQVGKLRGAADPASDYLSARAELYRHSPPPDSWQGEFWKKSKD